MAVSSVLSASWGAVTVCSVSHVPVVKVSDPSLRVTLSSLVPTATVTVPVGWVASRTVKVFVEPSVTVSVVADTVTVG